MKKSALIVFLVFCVMLSGCKNQSELGNSEVVTVFFVENRNELFEIAAYTAEYGDNGGELHKAYGKSVSTAYSSLMSGFLREPYLGHAGAIVLGGGLCADGLSETLSFFADLPEISPNISVFMSEDSPESFENGNIYDSVRHGYLPSVRLYTLFLPHNKTAVIPVISEINKTAEKSGAGVCEDMEFKFYLTESEYEIYRLLSNTLTDSYFDGLEVINTNCRTKNDGGNLKICAEIQVENSSGGDLSDISEKLTDEINGLTKKAKENNFKEIFSDGKWNTAEADVKVTEYLHGRLRRD